VVPRTPRERLNAARLGLKHGWELEMFNESGITLDPTDVLVNGSGSGGAPHTRCISGATRRGPLHGADDSLDRTFELRSADVPCVSTGKPSPFPTPRDMVPDMREGVAFNWFNNIWSTNYVLWYPFTPEDRNLKARFSMRFAETLP
jgi:hypothetical protein